MQEVKGLKLTTGEELVATILETKHNQVVLNDGLGNRTEPLPISYLLKDPMVLRIQPTGQGTIGLAFVPWTLSNPDLAQVPIPASFVMAVFDTSLEVEKQYLQQTSGILLQ